MNNVSLTNVAARGAEQGPHAVGMGPPVGGLPPRELVLFRIAGLLAVSPKCMVGARPRGRKLFATLIAHRAGFLNVQGSCQRRAWIAVDLWLKTEENWVIIIPHEISH
jgi:hypothetical protein